ARKNLQVERDFNYDSKEFAFTKLMKCGICGSGVTGQEKFKKLADGGTAKYIYYGCTRSRDRGCNSKYLREEDLILQLLQIIDQNYHSRSVTEKTTDEVVFSVIYRQSCG